MGTNSPEYRHRYLEIFRRLFERVRNIYERALVPLRKHKPILYYNEAIDFVIRMIQQCAETLYPEVAFEIACPVLEIWLMLLYYFGVYDYEIRKNCDIKGCHVLRDKGVFTRSNFYAVAILLQSSFENIRSLALAILEQFPKDFEFPAQELWNEAISITNKLVIRQFESGCRLLTYIFDRFPERLTGVEKKY